MNLLKFFTIALVMGSYVSAQDGMGDQGAAADTNVGIKRARSGKTSQPSAKKAKTAPHATSTATSHKAPVMSGSAGDPAIESPNDSSVSVVAQPAATGNSKNENWSAVKCATDCAGDKCRNHGKNLTEKDQAYQCAFHCKGNAISTFGCVVPAFNTGCSERDAAGRIVGVRKSKVCAQMSFIQSAILSYAYNTGYVLFNKEGDEDFKTKYSVHHKVITEMYELAKLKKKEALAAQAQLASGASQDSSGDLAAVTNGNAVALDVDGVIGHLKKLNSDEITQVEQAINAIKASQARIEAASASPKSE